MRSRTAGKMETEQEDMAGIEAANQQQPLKAGRRSLRR